jgi:hypothetical protein
MSSRPPQQIEGGEPCASSISNLDRRGTFAPASVSLSDMWFPTRVLVCLLTCGFAEAQERVPQARDAVAEIVRLFDSTRIVMLGEVHGSIQFDDFLKKLVTTRGFTDRVNDVVIEPANARYQGVLDRFIAGEDVTNDQLRPLWEDFVGSPSGAATSPHHGLLTTIRELNRTLPAERKLRVLAGDPPIDWGRVQSRDDISPFLPFRDEHYASVVRYEVLAKRRKALLVMGAFHFQRRDGKPSVIEQQMLNAFVKPYVIIAGSDVVHTYDDVDPRFVAVGQPSPWIAEMKGSWIGALPRWSDGGLIGFPGGVGPNRGAVTQSGTWDQVGDAYLFLGTRDSLITGGEKFDLEGTPYGEEIRRRWKILFPNPPSALPKSDGSTRPLFLRPAPPALPKGPAPQ